MPAPAAATPAAGGLKALGLRLCPGSPFISYVTFKVHKAAGEAHVQGPALFVAGLPLSLDEGGVAAVFGCFGDVRQVVLHPSKVRGDTIGSRACASRTQVELERWCGKHRHTGGWVGGLCRRTRRSRRVVVRPVQGAACRGCKHVLFHKYVLPGCGMAWLLCVRRSNRAWSCTSPRTACGRRCRRLPRGKSWSTRLRSTRVLRWG